MEQALVWRERNRSWGVGIGAIKFAESADLVAVNVALQERPLGWQGCLRTLAAGGICLSSVVAIAGVTKNYLLVFRCQSLPID